MVGRKTDGADSERGSLHGSFMLAALDVSEGDVMLDPDATGRVLFDAWVEGSSLGEFHAIGCRRNPGRRS